MKHWYTFFKNICIFIFFISVTLGLLIKNVNALESDFYKTKYDVIHTLQKDNTIATKLVVGLTNLRADVYVTQFSITIPSTSKLSELKATSPSGAISTKESQVQGGTKITFEFEEPIQGKQVSNLLEISFVQDELVQRDGNTVEILLPTFASSQSPSRVTFETVGLIDKALTISKPKPSLNDKIDFKWEAVDNPIIYLVFGDYQLYRAKLRYSLFNDRLVTVRQDVAFPPETLNQSILIKSIIPQPNEVRIDEDGNFIGRYLLRPQETKNIVFDGYIKVLSSDQESMLPYIRQAFNKQREYLLTQQKYWSINDVTLLSNIRSLDTPRKIYDFVEGTLSYSYDRFNKVTKRLGAEGGYKDPTSSVCMEYTDLYVGVARENGIFAREIQGFGYSKDPKLRPQSLQSDILHAWPSYYDLPTARWIQLDPTWQDTSGIDYLTGFDLNHIAFAIHGKNSVYPLPAGMYKSADTKDVNITVVTSQPSPHELLSVSTHFNKTLNSGEQLKGELIITNTGNVFLKNLPVILSENGLIVNPSKKIIFLIAPFQTIKIPIMYETDSNNMSKVSLTIPIGDLYANTVNFDVFSRSVQNIKHATLLIIITFGSLAFLWYLLRRV